MPRYFIELSYCGTNHHGWQIQSNTANTIQQITQDVLSTTLRHTVSLTGCGRTDTGVHARQFFAHFDSDVLSEHPFEFWIHKWNSMLPHSIAIHRILPVVDTAHSRYSATSRTYEYHIHQKKDPFLHQLSWYFPQSMTHAAIQDALPLLMQEQDFACFTKDADEYVHTQCHIYKAEWKVSTHQIIFIISANRFLRNMVRSIVGTLVWLGTGKISLQEFQHILSSKDRKNAGFSAPAEGLYLTHIAYPSHIFIQ